MPSSSFFRRLVCSKWKSLSLSDFPIYSYHKDRSSLCTTKAARFGALADRHFHERRNFPLHSGSRMVCRFPEYKCSNLPRGQKHERAIAF